MKLECKKSATLNILLVLCLGNGCRNCRPSNSILKKVDIEKVILEAVIYGFVSFILRQILLYRLTKDDDTSDSF